MLKIDEKISKKFFLFNICFTAKSRPSPLNLCDLKTNKSKSLRESLLKNARKLLFSSLLVLQSNKFYDSTSSSRPQNSQIRNKLSPRNTQKKGRKSFTLARSLSLFFRRFICDKNKAH
jgi:hypothetical protein